MGVAASASTSWAGTPPAVREQAAELLPRSAELTTALNDHLFAMMPELRERDDGELREETWSSCESNVLQVLRLLMSGAGPDAIVMPVEAAEWARSLVRRGITLAALLRAYRLGHAWFWDRWTQLLHDRLLDAEAFIEAQECSSAFLFAYIDHMSAVLVEEYGSERERVVRGAEQLRAETVRALLGGEPDRRGGRRRPAGLRAASPPRRAARLGARQRAARPRARRARGGGGARSGRAARGAVRRRERRRLVRSVRVAAGSSRSMPMRPRRGSSSRRARRGTGSTASGARTTRRCRPRASRRWRATRQRRSPATTGSSSSRCSPPISRARERSSRAGSARWHRRSEPAARLRETVLALLVAGGSATRVAKQLFVHQNTVAYRVKRAEELLGRRVTDDPVELTCALALVAVLGAAVLPEDGEEPAVTE